MIGFDIGGSNLRAAAFRGEDPAPIATHRELLGDDRRPETIVERIAEIAAGFGGDGSIGVGIAAMLRDARGTVANSPHLRWRGVPFGDLLRARLPKRRIRIVNDATAIAWGEHVAGAARGHAHALVVYVGTGIGGGVVANGQIVEGATACAGEIGHAKVVIGPGAAPCACGMRGCIEAYAGGSYLLRRIREVRGPGVLPDQIDAEAARGEPWASAYWAELADLLALALGNAIAVLNSSILVLGGGVLSRTPHLFALIERALPRYCPAPNYEPLAVARSLLGDDAGLVGAARLATA